MASVSEPQCDIILPVYNGLYYVRRCVESLLAYTDPATYHLYIMDDVSDAQTYAYLQQIAASHAHITLIRNETNLGFLKNCNKGMQLGNAPFTLLLNTDCFVTPGWLNGLLEAAESDPRIAAVNPLTNYAANISIPLAPGLSYFDMHAHLQQHAPRTPVDVVTSVGFCLLLRRSALAQVGLFDEIYGMGYCEESDLAMRLTTNGFRTVTAPWVYVYHKGSASFDARDERYRKNRALFDARWKREYLRQWRTFCNAAPLKPFAEMFTCQSRLALRPYLRDVAKQCLAHFKRRYWRSLLGTALRGVLQLQTARRPVANAAYLTPLKQRESPFSVTYILPTLDVAGGVLSVVQLVDEMVQNGIDARIAALYEADAFRDWPVFSRPMLYANPAELIANLPESDLIVATHWMTAKWAAALKKRERCREIAYFLQDYEAWFYPEADPKRDRVKATYSRIDHKIVKSDWLAGMLTADGYATRKITLGMNLDVFYPRPRRDRTSTIIAMARPRTPNRGYPDVIAALAQVKQTKPEVCIILFGEPLTPSQVPFEATLAGIISDGNQLAKLYSEADVFLDGSTFQGFGRTALEAMACGVACVVTNVGGVNEYAQDGINCLTVPPSAPDAFARAMLQLLEDRALRGALVAGGFETVKAYDHRREAKETAEYFQSLLEQK